ncbi:MAG: TIM barrel protein, partial [Clostridia bacterium]|nr:TIM barrel protein [Clostridia bacterium]
WSRETMKTLAEMAEKAGVNLLIENVGEPAHQNVLYDQQTFIELFEHLPESAGALIDIGHAMVNNWDIHAVIDALGPRICGYHIHNNDGTRDQHLPLFQPGAQLAV